MKRQRGFSLVTALFLLTVIAGLAVVLSKVIVSGNVTSSNEILASRAYYAARSGMELAIAAISQDPARNCPSLPNDIEGFQIELLTCVRTAVNEADALYHVFELRILARSGSKLSANLVRRTLDAMVKIDAP